VNRFRQARRSWKRLSPADQPARRLLGAAGNGVVLLSGALAGFALWSEPGQGSWSALAALLALALATGVWEVRLPAVEQPVSLLIVPLLLSVTFGLPRAALLVAVAGALWEGAIREGLRAQLALRAAVECLAAGAAWSNYRVVVAEPGADPLLGLFAAAISYSLVHSGAAAVSALGRGDDAWRAANEHFLSGALLSIGAPICVWSLDVWWTAPGLVARLWASALLLAVAFYVRSLGVRFRETHSPARGDSAHVYDRAEIDEITQLPNARACLRRLRVQLGRASCEGQQLAVLFFDMNNFKPVNDTYGHLAGDRVLNVVAQRLRNAMRRSDFLGRLGGDEFLALLYGVGSRELPERVQRLRRAVESRPIRLARGGSAAVSISVGGAVFPDDGTEPEQLIHLSDLRMYRDKQANGSRSERAVPAV